MHNASVLALNYRNVKEYQALLSYRASTYIDWINETQWSAIRIKLNTSILTYRCEIKIIWHYLYRLLYIRANLDKDLARASCRRCIHALQFLHFYLMFYVQLQRGDSNK